jgi:pimeloyl-ACP methyl ester carboxylesterase
LAGGAGDHDTGHDRQRPARPRRAARQRRVPRRRLPNSRLEIIDAGHFVWEEAPAEYAAIILDTIASH